MPRFLPAAILVLAWLGPSRAEDPVPVWKADLKEKGQSIAPVDAVAFSRDGSLFVARVQQPLTRLPGAASIVVWDRETRKEASRGSTVIMEWQAPGPLVAPNGPKDWLAVDGRSIVRLAVESGKLVKTDRERGAAVWSISEGEFIAASVYESETALTWIREVDPRTGSRSRGVGLLRKHPDEWPITVLAIDPAGRQVAAARYLPKGREVQLTLDSIDNDGVVSVRRRSEGNAGETGRMSCAVFSPDGKLLATGGDDGLVRIWDTTIGWETGWSPKSWVNVTRMSIAALAFHPGGKHLAFSTTNGGRLKPILGFLDVATGKVVRQFEVASGHWSLAFSPDGSHLLTGNHLGVVELWDVKSILKN